MAPSFDIGTPQRSLVRIPGSGQDKTLKPICLDVAQISNFSINLSNIINFNFNAPPEQALRGTLNISSIPPSTLPSATATLRRDLAANNGQQDNGTSRKRSSEEEQSQSIKKRHPTSESSILRNINLDRKQRVEKMKLLKEEEQKLIDENRELSNKVAMFKDILRSRTKLKEFLKSLQEISCN